MNRSLPGPVGDDAGAFNYCLWRSDPFGFLSNLGRVYGDIVGFHLGVSPCILVNGAPEVRELLTRQEAHLRKPGFVKDSNRADWGDGLATLEAEPWRTRRKAVRPGFTASMVSAFSASVIQCTTEMLDTWRTGSVVDLQYELRMLVARIALRTVLDADIEGAKGLDQRSGIVSRSQAYGEDRRSISGGDQAAPLWQVRPRAPSSMEVVVRIIDARMASGEQRADILSSLLGRSNDKEPAWRREDIIGEIMQMLYAGHLTIPASLMSFWREVAGFSGTLQLQIEADRYRAGQYQGSATQVGPHCLALLKECLRLHPPAPVLYREVETAFVLGGHDFEQDVLIMVSPQLLHHDPRYFVQPNRFMPQRFLASSDTTEIPIWPADDAVDGVTKAAPFLPFGMGPRTCIARHLAMQQMVQMILLVSGRFCLQPTQQSKSSFLVESRH